MNWRVARDTFWEVVNRVVHVIQPGNWRGHVMQVTHYSKTKKPIIRHKKFGSGLVPAKSTGAVPDRNRPKFHRDRYRNQNSSRVLEWMHFLGIIVYRVSQAYFLLFYCWTRSDIQITTTSLLGLWSLKSFAPIRKITQKQGCGGS